MNKIIFAVLIFVIYTSNIYSQNKTDSSDFESNPQFRSVQIDASTLIYVTKIGAAIDYDLFSNHNKSKIWQSLGLRFGGSDNKEKVFLKAGADLQLKGKTL